LAFGVNTLGLVSGGKTYPCCHLPVDLCLPPDQREAYIEIGEGSEPVKARVWMSATQFQALPSETRSGASPVGISMSGQTMDLYNPTTADGRTLATGTKLYVIKASVVQHGLSDSIYEVLLRGEQWFWARGAYTAKYYNVLGVDRKTYSMGFAGNATNGTSFATIISALTAQLGITAELPYTPVWKPQNVYADSSPGNMLDRLLRPLGLRLVCNPWGGWAYAISQLNYTDDYQLTILANLAAKAGHEGCNVARDITSAALCPAAAVCRFLQYPIPLGDTDRYMLSNSAANPIPGGNGTARLNVNDYYSRSDNATEIANIASERTTNFFRRVNIPHDTWTFIGGYPFVPGATIRRVRVAMDRDGWFTVVQRHGLALPLRADQESLQFWPDAARFSEYNLLDGGAVPMPGDDGTVNFEYASPRFWSKITGSAQIGAAGSNRWSYTFEEAMPGLAGAWQTLPGGRTGTAYNTMEANNSAAGIQGSGDNQSNLPPTITLLPIGSGAVVEIRAYLDCATPPNTLYDFQAPNNPGGSCP